METRVHGQGMKLTTHLHLVPTLRMSGTVPLLIYAFIAWMGKTLPFCINLDEFILVHISFHKLKAMSYVCLICQRVVDICQEYNVTRDKNCTTRNVP